MALVFFNNDAFFVITGIIDSIAVHTGSQNNIGSIKVLDIESLNSWSHQHVGGPYN